MAHNVATTVAAKKRKEEKEEGMKTLVRKARPEEGAEQARAAVARDEVEV